MTSKFANVKTDTTRERAGWLRDRSRRNHIWHASEINEILKEIARCPRGGQKALLKVLSLKFKTRITTGHLAFWRRRALEERRK